MDYELAERLWKAGYPFKRRGDDLVVTCLCTKDVCDGPFGREFRFEGNLYPEPTLSELIDACGDGWAGFGSLRKTEVNWLASTPTEPDEGRHYVLSQKGKTPSEAVARLWLVLNDQKK